MNLRTLRDLDAILERQDRPTAPALGPFTAWASQHVALTAGQLALCRVVYDGAEPQGDLCRSMLGPVAHIPAEARHVVVVVAGGRAGKSYVLGALRLLHLALSVPLTTLAPGEAAEAIVVAPDLRLSRHVLRYVRGIAGPAMVAETADSITIRRPDGHQVILDCLPASRGGSAVRGRSLVGAFLDEAAFFRDADYRVNDEDVFRALAPRIVRGGQLIVASTPWAETGLLYRFWREEFGRPATAIVAHAPTLLLRPDAAPEVARERKRDPENARREFDAEFLPAGSALYFDSRAIDACTDASPRPLPPMHTGTACVGADLGFRSDSSAAVVAEYDGEHVHVMDLLELRPEKGRPLTPSRTIAEIAELARRYEAPGVMADQHYAEAVREHLAAADLALLAAPEGQPAKLETYAKLRALLLDGAVRLPAHPRLLDQLRQVTAVPTAGGNISIRSPRTPGGGHGDLVSALVLAVWQAARLVPERTKAEGPRVLLDEYEQQATAELEAAEAREEEWGSYGIRTVLD